MATLKVDGKVYENVKKIKAKTDTDAAVDFVDTSDATATAGDITSGKSAYVNGEIVIGTNTHTEPNDLDGIIDGTITDFVMPNGKTIISPYRFYQFTSLKSINFGGVKEIGKYAFYECKNIDNIELPATITKIGDYAMYYLGSNKTAFQFHPAELCTIDSYGLSYSKISKIVGKLSLGTYALSNCASLTEIDAEFTAVGDGAFRNCSKLSTIKMKVNGSIGQYALFGLTMANTVDISPDSVITSLGNYCFSRLGGSRANPETNIIVLDFSKSTFSSIPQYAFGGDNSSDSNKNRYMKITFPITVSEIKQYAFRYSDNCEYYFTSETPPTLSATTSWNNATNYKIFVPFSSINAYKTASNWTAQTDYIKGYAPAGTFSVGYTLPEINVEGYALTWYSDKACTTQVTTVTDANAELYCLAGDEKVGYGIKSISTLDCAVSITDGNGKSYMAGEGVRTGTILTIIGTSAIEGYEPYILVNAERFDSGSSLTVSGDINIIATYWDGVNIPISSTFANNEWSTIFFIFRAGTASQLWNIGDTKPFTSKSGKNYTLRIADMTADRYNLADDSGTTNGVLEFVECYNLKGKTAWVMNSTEKEGYYTGGGYAMSDMANTHLEQIFNDLPDDLQAAISEITLTEYSYTSPSPRSGNHRLFLPAETEMFDARHNSAEGSSVYPKYAQFGYYAENNTKAARIKKDIGGTSGRSYWLRSPYLGNGNTFCNVGSGGSYYDYVAYGAIGVAPCFAI